MVLVREGTSADLRPAFEVFRRSLWDLLQRQGAVGADQDDDVDKARAVMGPFVDHLAEHAAEFWVAEGDEGLVGMARSLERGGVFQLTEFFVDPGAQSAGVGRSLLDRAFPIGRGRHRSIIATTDPRALGLYLRYGVQFQTMLVNVEFEPVTHAYETDLEFLPVAEVERPLEAIAALDRRHLDHERSVEIAFLMENRPGFLYRRDGEFVGYGFESKGRFTGPVLVADPADLPAALSHLENSAAAAGVRQVDLEIALDARAPVQWMLGRGHRFFPFYTTLLGSSAFVPRDRYVFFGPSLFI